MESEFILKRIDQALHELYKQKLLSGQTFKLTRDLTKDSISPRKTNGPAISSRPISTSISPTGKTENGRPKSMAILPSNTYVGPPAPNPSQVPALNKGNNAVPYIAPKPRQETNSVEKPGATKNPPIATPPLPTRSPVPYSAAETMSKPQIETKPTSPIKPSLPTKPAPHINRNIEEVNVSIDPKAASSLAKTAYSSGAAKTLIQGSKPTYGPNGVSVKVDPEAAKKAAVTMHSAGATGELIQGLRVNTPPPSIPSASSKPKRVPKYKAVRAFVAEQEGDLPLKIGDSVFGVEEVDDNWYRGESNGMRGIFPKNFVVAELE